MIEEDPSQPGAVEREVAKVAASVGDGRRTVNQLVSPIFGIFALFVIIVGIGLARQIQNNSNLRRDLCLQVNGIRVEQARILVAGQASIPAANYTAKTKAFYDGVLDNLKLTDCDNPPALPDRPVEFPQIAEREVGEAPPAQSPEVGPAGSTGLPGVAGMTGAIGAGGPAGPPGEEGPPGPVGLSGTNGGAGSTVVGPSGAMGPPGPVGPPGMDAPQRFVCTPNALLSMEFNCVPAE